MKKYLFISFIISIFFTSNVFASCNFQIIDFGKSKDHLKKKLNYDESMELMMVPDEFGGELVFAPLFETCNLSVPPLKSIEFAMLAYCM